MPRNTVGNLQTRPVGRTFLRAWREHRKLTQDELAERAGITKASLSRVERGKQPYNQRILESVASALDCTPADLLSRDPQDTTGPWMLWELLKPAQRKHALRMLRTFVEDSELAA